MPVKRLSILMVAVGIALGGTLAGCGDASSTQPARAPAATVDRDTSPSDSGCLTPDQVDEQVNEIANGVETSNSQVEAKQAAIQAIRGRAC